VSGVARAAASSCRRPGDHRTCSKRTFDSSAAIMAFPKVALRETSMAGCRALLRGNAAQRLLSMFMTSNIHTMRPSRRSPIALAVLVMLYEAPMHPYRMQRLIKERGKDEVINVTQRASLYQTIRRLEREGLISAQRTIRDDRWPERTVYKITTRGRAVALDWMREILSKPAREYPEFPAAISFLPLLSPEDALYQLELRAKAIGAERERIDQGLNQAAQVPRLFLLEVEYLRAVLTAELTWVNSIVKDLRAARLTWSESWLRQITAELSGDSESGS